MAQPQRRPSLDSDVEEDPESGKKVRIKVFLKVSLCQKIRNIWAPQPFFKKIITIIKNKTCKKNPSAATRP